jgi:hypothetical protein
MASSEMGTFTATFGDLKVTITPTPPLPPTDEADVDAATDETSSSTPPTPVAQEYRIKVTVEGPASKWWTPQSLSSISLIKGVVGVESLGIECKLMHNKLALLW